MSGLSGYYSLGPDWANPNLFAKVKAEMTAPLNVSDGDGWFYDDDGDPVLKARGNDLLKITKSTGAVQGNKSFAADVDVVGDLTAGTVASDGAVSGTDGTFTGDVAVTGLSTLTGGWAAGAVEYKVATVAVTATQLRNLAATPKELVAAVPGAAHVFLGMFVRYLGGANGFDSVDAGEDLQVKYTDASGQAVSPILDTTSDIDFSMTTDDESWMPPVATVVNPVTNAALILDQVGTGELAAADDNANGDGTLSLTVLYYTITV